MNPLKLKTLNKEWKEFIFQNMPEMNENISFHRFKKGQIIFYEGHIPYGLFILVSGNVQIISSKNNYQSDKRKIISNPAFLGTFAFKNKIPFSATLKALTDCDVYFLSYSYYHNLQGSNHPIQQWINRYIE